MKRVNETRKTCGGGIGVERCGAPRAGRASRSRCALFVAYGLVLAGLVPALACHRNPYVIPLQPSAQAQFNYARALEKPYRSPLRARSRKDDYARALAAYRAVLEKFPEDRLWPPRARLRIALMQESEGEKSVALRTYENLIKEYPNADDIQAAALYGAALIYDERKEFEKAQAYYDAILKRFGNPKNTLYARYVREARLRSQIVKKK
jgi:tetratricopeptide (TPR) repeat protein